MANYKETSPEEILQQRLEQLEKGIENYRERIVKLTEELTKLGAMKVAFKEAIEIIIKSKEDA